MAVKAIRPEGNRLSVAAAFTRSDGRVAVRFAGVRVRSPRRPSRQCAHAPLPESAGADDSDVRRATSRRSAQEDLHDQRGGGRRPKRGGATGRGRNCRGRAGFAHDRLRAGPDHTIRCRGSTRHGAPSCPRRVRQGTPSIVVSSWIPPESVRTGAPRLNQRHEVEGSLSVAGR